MTYGPQDAVIKQAMNDGNHACDLCRSYKNDAGAFSWTVSVHSFVLSHSSMVQSAVFVLAQQRGGRTEERKSSRFIMYIHLH